MTGVALAFRTHVAVVRGPDGVRFSASGFSESDVDAQLASYVRDRCEDVLWPAAAGEVRRLIAAGDVAKAIAVYFANVGRRWDMEWLNRRATS